jgi:aspartate/methionine/tyrosine aminotransferase
MRKLTKYFGTYSIAKYEKATGKGVMDLLDIGNFEVNKLANIIMLGNKDFKSEEEAYDRLDEYLKSDEDNSLITAYFDLIDEVDLICGTFSKSLASLGGYCACSREVAEFLRHNSRPFIFSASITPGCLAATLEALRIIKTEPERVAKLTEVAEYMRKLLRERNIKFADSKAPIIALFTYDQEVTLTVCKRLFEEGVYANPVLPPATPPGQCLVRTTYTTTHTNEELEEAADVIAKVFKEFGLIEE